MSENIEVSRNKERLVCKWYAQEEGIDYGEKNSYVARLEGFRILLSYVIFEGFKVYKMDVKSSFLNGILEDNFTLISLIVLLIQIKETWFACYTNLYMVWSKLLEHGTRDYMDIW